MKKLLFLFLIFGGGISAQEKTGTIRVRKPAADTVSTGVISQAIFFGGDDFFDDGSDPVFPGGKSAMGKFIDKNMKLPDTRFRSVSLVTSVRFSVNTDGSLSNIRIQSPTFGCKECDAEALRIVSTMPRWKPGTYGGQPIGKEAFVDVVFKFPK
jgi:hypothetical protein